MDRRPTYVRLADELASGLAELPPTRRLPSENEIVTDRGVSRVTARAALQELERRHLVRRVRGRGTFPALRIDYLISARMAPSWSAVVAELGLAWRYDLVSVRRCDSEHDLPDGVPPLRRGGATTLVTRRGWVAGLPSTLGRSWLPNPVGDAALEAIGRGESLYRALESSAGPMRRRWCRAELTVAPSDVAEQLDVGSQPLVWRVDSCNTDTGGATVEISSAWMRADVFRVRFELGDTTP